MESNGPQKNNNVKKEGTLGTFAGVFTPSIMTILGIILFLRLGYVVGSAGLCHALIIIALANTISVLTSVSLSAVATNLRVKGGGDYYLISRTLGIEFGGAIGIVLFLAQAVSIAFYCIGFGEVLSSILQNTIVISPQIIAAFAATFLFFFAWLGTDWATKFQYVVMTLLVFALISFFIGGLGKWDASLFARNWTVPTGNSSFWILFAIFFPAVTGFTQGVSMSGDLKDPGKSLPLGTFLAVGISILVYFGVALVFAGSLTNETMKSEYHSMWRVARIHYLIDAGVIAATLSSAMASFLGAPRILQALSSDCIFPLLSNFSKGYGPTNNPRPAVLLSLGIAYITITLGNLNAIAPVVSMFFLVSYGLLNYATFYEARSSSPSFRPKFRWFDYRVSLLGFISCLAVMFAIDLTASAIALSVLFAIYQYLKRTAGPARWADSQRSHHLQQVREHLLAADLEPEHARDWRPQILAVSNDSQSNKQLLVFASWLQGGSGLITATRILEGDGLKFIRLRKKTEDELRKDIADLNLQAFPLAFVSPTYEMGLHALIQAYGIGPIKANTILISFLDELSKGIPNFKHIIHIQNLKTVFHLGCNIIILKATDSDWQALENLTPEKRRIDVWWWNDATSHLMLLLAYLMTRDENWDQAKIRVLAACYDEKTEKNLEDLKNTLSQVRIEAEPEIVENLSARSLKKHSDDAAMVFLPFKFKSNRILAPSEHDIAELAAELPITAMVFAAKEIDLDAEPEEGTPEEVAHALDAIDETRKRSHEIQKNAKQATKAALEAEKKLRQKIEASGPGASRDVMEQIEKAAKNADKAQKKAKMAIQKAIKAKTVAEQIAHEAKVLGVHTPKNGENPE